MGEWIDVLVGGWLDEASLEGVLEGVGMPWGRSWGGPGDILRSGEVRLSVFEGFGGIFGSPVRSKSDPGERLSCLRGVKGRQK